MGEICFKQKVTRIDLPGQKRTNLDIFWVTRFESGMQPCFILCQKDSSHFCSYEAERNTSPRNVTSKLDTYSQSATVPLSIYKPVSIPSHWHIFLKRCKSSINFACIKSSANHIQKCTLSPNWIFIQNFANSDSRTTRSTHNKRFLQTCRDALVSAAVTENWMERLGRVYSEDLGCDGPTKTTKQPNLL